MITKRVNADGSITVGIIEEEVEVKEVKEEKPKATAKKTTTKKTSKTK